MRALKGLAYHSLVTPDTMHSSLLRRGARVTCVSCLRLRQYFLRTLLVYAMRSKHTALAAAFLPACMSYCQCSLRSATVAKIKEDRRISTRQHDS